MGTIVGSRSDIIDACNCDILGAAIGLGNGTD